MNPFYIGGSSMGTQKVSVIRDIIHEFSKDDDIDEKKVVS